MFSITLGLEEILIGILVDIFERFPSTNMGCAGKGLLNQSNFLSIVGVEDCRVKCDDAEDRRIKEESTV